jgi:hypothetical protein
MTIPSTPTQLGGGGLRERDTAQRGPRSGESVAEVLADGDAEVAVEGLEDDVDGLLAAGPRVGGGGRAGELGHEERPADEAEELDERRQHTDGRGEGEERRLRVGDGAR